MMDGFSRFHYCLPLPEQERQGGVGVLNTWVKDTGGIWQTFHTDNGKEFTAHMAQQLYNKLGIYFNFWWAENHQSNPIERFHCTLYSLINSLRAEGKNNFVECAKTAVMLYNGARHSSTGVTPNMLFLGWEGVLPSDLFQGRQGNGPTLIWPTLQPTEKYHGIRSKNCATGRFGSLPR